MSQVAVTISGRSYRIACGAGEERRLAELAAMLDGKIEEMRAAFGEIGDIRLHVMAGISIADELAEARRRTRALEEELAALRALASDGDERSRLVEARMAEGIARAAERLERLAKSINPAIG